MFGTSSLSLTASDLQLFLKFKQYLSSLPGWQREKSGKKNVNNLIHTHTHAHTKQELVAQLLRGSLIKQDIFCGMGKGRNPDIALPAEVWLGRFGKKVAKSKQIILDEMNLAAEKAVCARATIVH